ncbi:Synuclein, partial [Candidatus Magnetomorum sp. HK-1]
CLNGCKKLQKIYYTNGINYNSFTLYLSKRKKMPYFSPYFKREVENYFNAISNFFYETKADTVEAICDAAEFTLNGVKYIGKKTLEGIEFVIDGVVYIAQKTADGIVYVSSKVIEGLSYVGEKTIEGVTYTIMKAKDGFIYVGKKTSEGVVFIKDSFLTGENLAIAIFAGTIAHDFTDTQIEESITRLLLSIPKKDDSQKEYDGLSFGRDCEQIILENDISGYCPSMCLNGCKKLQKIYYTNGINTSKESMCRTMQKIADLTCSQVFGIYNATEGMGSDLTECLENIQSDDAPSVLTQEKLILEKLQSDPPKPVTIYAHSQGGLITQLALKKAITEVTLQFTTEEELNAFLSKYITIKSFGTVVFGWPKGPNYEHFTNICDPVPVVISSVQLNNKEHVLDDHPDAMHHLFRKPFLNPIDAHSMDNVYLEKFMNEQGKKNCKCD